MFDTLSGPLAWFASMFAAVATLLASAQAPAAVPPLPSPPQEVSAPAAGAPLAPAVQPSAPPENVMDEGDREDMKPSRPLNTQWARDTQREIKDLLNEIKRLKKEVKKDAAALEALTRLESLVKRYPSRIQDALKSGDGDELEDVLREFHDPLEAFNDKRPWDVLNDIRARAQIPRELKDIAKDLTFLGKLVASKSFLKAAQEFGLSVDTVNGHLAARQAIVDEVKAALGQQDYEAAQEAMQGFHQDRKWPGEMRMLEGFREAYSRIREIPNAEIRDMIKEMIQEVVALVHDDEYQEARMASDTLRQAFDRYQDQFRQFAKGRVVDDKMEARFEALRKNFEEKMQALESKQEPKEAR